MLTVAVLCFGRCATDIILWCWHDDSRPMTKDCVTTRAGGHRGGPSFLEYGRSNDYFDESSLASHMASIRDTWQGNGRTSRDLKMAMSP